MFAKMTFLGLGMALSGLIISPTLLIIGCLMVGVAVVGTVISIFS